MTEKDKTINELRVENEKLKTLNLELLDKIDELKAQNRSVKLTGSGRPKTGRWVNKKYRWIKSISMWWSAAYECAVCGEAGIKDWNYCPSCGAKMEDE